MIFKLDEMTGIINLRLIGYYKIKQGILQQNLSRYYKFEKAEKLCKYFNKFCKHIEERKRAETTRG